MKFLFAVLTAMLASSAIAGTNDLVIYRFTESSRSIGGGAEVKIKGQGYLVLNFDTFEGKVISVATIRGDKIMTITDLVDTTEYQITGLTRTYTAFQLRTVLEGPAEEHLAFSYSPNSPLRLERARSVIEPGRFINYPRSFTESFQGVSDDGSAFNLYAGRRTYGFRATDTLDANANGLDVDAVIAVYRDYYADKGYVQLDP